MNTVDAYLEKHSTWLPILEQLRAVLLTTELEETIKWGAPTYTINNKNVIGIGAFKNHCGLWFFQGALLKDEHNVLLNAQEGKTKALRQWRFEADSIINTKLLLLYINEAINNQKEGLSIKPSAPKKLILPHELTTALHTSTTLKNAFDSFSYGKQKEFAQYITEAKRETTKLSRLEKIKPMILKGIGLNDKYRNS